MRRRLSSQGALGTVGVGDWAQGAGGRPIPCFMPVGANRPMLTASWTSWSPRRQGRWPLLSMQPDYRSGCLWTAGPESRW